MVRLLRSPRVVIAVLAYGAIYCAVGASLPWSLHDAVPPPVWAVALGLDRPFSAWPFLAGVAVLFASALACTWGRWARTRAIFRGELPSSALELAPRAADVRSFLVARGYGGRGEVLRRFGFALWGSFFLHLGLVVLVAAVLVQQAFNDSGFFELSEGQMTRLSAGGTVLAREKGRLAPASPPDLWVALEQFDPFLRQEGYARDRSSRIAVTAREGAPRVVAMLDRAAGVRMGGVEIFQGSAAGLAVNVDISGMGPLTIRLTDESDRVASALVSDPAGRRARFIVTAERPLTDPIGTGPVRLELEQDGRRLVLPLDVPFSFGDREARLISIGRWGRFTYSRSPGMPGVLAAFALILAGCALLAFPAGVACIGLPGSGPAARLFQPRGNAALVAEWQHQRTESR